MASRVAALLVGLICVGFAAAQIVLDCCKDKSERPFPIHLIQSYTIQEAGKGCDKSATVLQAGRQLCVSHPSEQAWVQKHINAVEKRNQRHKKNQVLSPFVLLLSGLLLLFFFFLL
uniref:Chemokine interleukin-8-like domain-containing protein n=1 Tax=Mola mola TaxID=94237 RepID=A0A3Q3WMN4_MOLML